MSLTRLRNSFLFLRVTVAMVLLVACLGVDFAHQHAVPQKSADSDTSNRSGFNPNWSYQPDSLICHACVFTTSLVDNGVFLSDYINYFPVNSTVGEVVQLSSISPYFLSYKLRAPPVYSPV
jgi:hypothetical protein